MREHGNSDSGPGRPREFDEDYVLDQIMQAFWEHGYEGTGLSDIMKVTGLKKGSLYAAFGSKRNMFNRALEHYESQIVDAACQTLRGDDTPQVRLSSFLNSPIENVFVRRDYRGCFLCNSTSGRLNAEADTCNLLARGFAKLESALKNLVVQALPKLSDEKATALAGTLLTIYAGLAVTAKAAKDKQSLERTRDMALTMVFGE